MSLALSSGIGFGGKGVLNAWMQEVLLHGCTESKQSARLRGDCTVSRHSLDHADLWIPRVHYSHCEHTPESSFPEKAGR